MRKIRTRAFSILLTCAMLLSLLPMTALAADNVAEVNGIGYATLAEAFANVESGGTVIMLKDTEVSDPITVDKGKTVTLDMKSHKITVSDSFSTRLFTNYGNLTIKGNGAVDVTAAGPEGYGTVNNYGTLTVVGGTYTNLKESNASNFYNRNGGTATFENTIIYGGGGCIATEVNTTTTINGGYYEDSTYPAVENRGNMLITSGVFKNTSCSSCDNRWGYTVRSGESSDAAYLKIQGEAEDSVKVTGVQGGLAVIGGTADIYNGVYETVACETHTSGQSAYYAGYFTGESYKTATTIYGGRFQSVSKTAVQVGNNNPAPDSGAGLESIVMIKGGTFVGGDDKRTAITVNNEDNAIGGANITGGTFSSDVEKFVDRSSTMEKNEAGNWVAAPISESEGVAEINGKYYKTLGDAVASASDGDTIQVLKDIPDATGMSVPSGKNFTIDFGGHTYTLTGPGAGSTGTETNGFQLLKDSTITMKNGIVRIAEGANNIKRIIQNYADLTLENMQIHAKNQVDGEANTLSFNNGDIVFKGNTSVFTTSDDTVAFDVCYWQSGGYSGTNVTFAPDYSGTINGVIFYDSTDATKGVLTIQGNGTFGKIQTSQDSDKAPNISISGGVFADRVNAKYIVPGMKQDQNGKIIIDTDVAVAEVNGVGYTSLTAALNAASDGQTIKLLADSTGNTKVKIQDGRHLTLDMNGFDAGFVQYGNISIYRGGLDIIGSGKLYEEEPYYAPVMLYGSNDPQASDYTTITVGKDVILEGWSGLFIDQLKSNSGGVNAFGIKATVNGTLNSVKDITGAGGHALYINGTIKATEGNVPEIILNGATLNTELGNGMYLAGYVKTTITDSTITSVGTDSTGIEIRAGELTISGNTTVSGGTGEFVAAPNGNGSTSNNVALAVVQHTTKLPVIVTVEGGTFSGGAAIYQANEQGNGEEAVAKVQLFVLNGTFKGAIYSENKADFVSGGHFSKPVDEKYLDDSLNAQLKSASHPEAPYSYYTSMEPALAVAKPGDEVTPVRTSTDTKTYIVVLEYNDGSTGNVTCTVGENTTITLPTPTRSGYKFLGWYAGNTKVNSPYQVTGNVTLVAQWSYIDQGGGSGSGSGSSTPTYQVSVDKAEGGKITVSPTRAEKGETVTITVKPDEGYELGKLTVTDKDGDKVTLTQKDDNKYTFKMPAGKVTVKATFTEIEVEPEQPELPFSDVAEQDWFYDAVVYVYENELMNGTSATTFSPSVTTSRAMMLTMLARYDGVDTSTGSTWYEAGAAWAVAEGVSDGTNLEADLTREQLVTMLWRYAGSPMVEKDLPDYPDRDEVSDWAVRAMVWAVDNGIITGNGAGELNPQGSASRAEVATILMRFIQL